MTLVFVANNKMKFDKKILEIIWLKCLEYITLHFYCTFLEEYFAQKFWSKILFDFYRWLFPNYSDNKFGMV